MEPSIWVEAYGLWGLGGLAFLAATLLPFSSEVAVVAALAAGWTPWQVFISASAGNALGASVNYGLGWWASAWVLTKLEGSRAGQRAYEWMQRYGIWSLSLSWLPIVGDPICLAAGLGRLSWIWFVVLGIGTRVVRYGIVIYLWQLA